MSDSLANRRQASAEIEITPAMVEAGVRALQESGLIEHPKLISADLVLEVLVVALAKREMRVHADS